MNGRVHQVAVSDGGVPKLAVAGGYVGPTGLLGDRHNEPSHGGPNKALCLFALEVIEAVAAEGHSLFPGAVGENVTLAGVDWSLVKPGSRWRIGDEVEIEITSYTIPCKTNARWFLGGDFSRINQQLHPSSSRVYARIVTEGVIRPGDQFLPAI
ncbi:MAG: MOSC domain-containing protein [Acidimicrobiia bacterium]